MQLSKFQIEEFITESNAIEGITEPFSFESHTPEIAGQLLALSYVESHYNTQLSVSKIVNLHSLLMENLLYKDTLGLRKVNVRVGPRLCPPPIAIRPMLRQWCKNVNSLVNPTETQLWQTHLAFECIHPFIDGNGRSGRLLWLWLRLRHGFGYSCVYNATKSKLYYPCFDTFLWDDWDSSFQS